MATLWTFGDSMTFGHGCVLDYEGDEYYKKYKKSDDDLIWPVILANKLGYKLNNLGKCGASNDYIFDTIISNYHLISENDISNSNCFQLNWLKNIGFKLNFKSLKLTNNKFIAQFMNWVTPTKRSWNGHNSSGWKNDIIAVNGFNNEMQYGGEDREMGERMFNNGMLSKQIRYSAICIHLEHSRGYSSPEIWKKNNDIRSFNKKNTIIKTENGIDKV